MSEYKKKKKEEYYFLKQAGRLEGSPPAWSRRDFLTLLPLRAPPF